MLLSTEHLAITDREEKRQLITVVMEIIARVTANSKIQKQFRREGTNQSLNKSIIVLSNSILYNLIYLAYYYCFVSVICQFACAI
jgi:hypothetical protein